MELSIIQNKIYEIRGYRVILDKDLAQMYEVTTSNLNKAVKRNIDRFPEDFMFQLNNEEFNLIFQTGTSNWGGTRFSNLRRLFQKSFCAQITQITQILFI